jgi:hypothetical protein
VSNRRGTGHPDASPSTGNDYSGSDGRRTILAVTPIADLHICKPPSAGRDLAVRVGQPKVLSALAPRMVPVPGPNQVAGVQQDPRSVSGESPLSRVFLVGTVLAALGVGSYAVINSTKSPERGSLAYAIRLEPAPCESEATACFQGKVTNVGSVAGSGGCWIEGSSTGNVEPPPRSCCRGSAGATGNCDDHPSVAASCRADLRGKL